MPVLNRGAFRKELIEFYKNIALMAQSGIPLNESLGVLSEQAKSPSFKKFLVSVKEQLEHGSSLSKAFMPYRDLVGDLALNVIRAGEINGTLEGNLQYLADITNRNRELKQKISSAMLYPEIVLSMTFALGAGISMFILPKLIPLFNSLDVELPLATRILLWVSLFLKAHGIASIIGTVVIITALVLAPRFLSPVRWVYHTIAIHLPFLGSLIRNYQLALFNQIFGTLFKSGLTIKESMMATAEAVTNVRYKNALLGSVKRLTSGTALATILTQYPALFPQNMVALISVGEKSGKLEESFRYLAGYYENEVDLQTKRLPQLIEPMLLIFIGLAVGFIAIAVISPIYELTSGISNRK